MELDSTLLEQQYERIEHEISQLQLRMVELNAQKELLYKLSGGTLSNEPRQLALPQQQSPPTFKAPPVNTLQSELSLDTGFAHPEVEPEPDRQQMAEDAVDALDRLGAVKNYAKEKTVKLSTAKAGKKWTDLMEFIGTEVKTVDQCLRYLNNTKGYEVKRQSMQAQIHVMRKNGLLKPPEECEKGTYELTERGVAAVSDYDDKDPAEAMTVVKNRKKAGDGEIRPQWEAMLRLIALGKKPDAQDIMDHLDRIGKAVDSKQQIFTQIHRYRNKPFELVELAIVTNNEGYELTKKGMAIYGEDKEPPSETESPINQPKPVSVLPRHIEPAADSPMGQALATAAQELQELEGANGKPEVTRTRAPDRTKQIEQFNKGGFGRSKRFRRKRA